MPLYYISEKPTFITEEEHARSQESTPSTFQESPPILRLQLGNVRCHLQPSTAFPRSDQIRDGKENDPMTSVNGTTSNTESIHTGTLFLSDESVSFLTSDQKGFSLDYPSLSLHAISRSLPLPLQNSHSASGDDSCLYCQLDLSAGGEAEEEEDEEEDDLAELWIVPAQAGKVEDLFETLSRCASLHPSTTEEGEDGGFGNPFSSLGPFGTGVSNLSNGDERHALMQNDGAFEDAEEDNKIVGSSINLSDSGRATLAHLDSLLQMPNEDEQGYGTSPAASFHSSDPRQFCQSKAAEVTKATSVTPTEALLLVNVPEEVFYTPTLASALLDLLHAYGDMKWWLTLPGFGRAIVMYSDERAAKRAKEALDRILLPLVDEGEEEQEKSFDMEEDPDIQPRKQLAGDGEGLALRVYYGDPYALSRLRDQGEAHLPVPTTDKNFLISPPGSPPVGWEPIREDPPNTNTLADDLIKALGSLRDRGLGVRSHTPEPLDGLERSQKPNSRQNDHHHRTASSSSLAPPTASVIIPPSQTAVRSYHPLAKEAYDTSETQDEQSEGIVSLPGVTVENVDAEEDQQQQDGIENRMNKGLSISSVKATVESMRGAPAVLTSSDCQSSKITPTARPPLG